MSRILSIAPYKFLPPTSGGAWAVIWAEKMLSEYNEVTTITIKDNDMKDAGKWPFSVKNVLPDSRSRYIPYFIVRQLQQLCKRYQPDYLFCHHHYLFPAARYVADKLGIPLYIRSHNIESERFRTIGKWWWPLMRKFEQQSYHKADRVFFITEEDAAWAITNYGLSKEKAFIMPFPCDFDTVQTTDKDKLTAARENGLNPDLPWFLFMGVLDYVPNEKAVEHIINKLYPILKSKMPDFEIIICGKNLNEGLQEQIAKLPGIHYLGFVPDLNPILQHSSVMLNPVTSGGGVKTKVIESLSWNLTVVSARTGAVGVEQRYCGEKLIVVEDGDWEAMADKAIEASLTATHIPGDFFDFYYIKNVAQRLQQYFK